MYEEYSNLTSDMNSGFIHGSGSDHMTNTLTPIYFVQDVHYTMHLHSLDALNIMTDLPASSPNSFMGAIT